MPGSTRLVDLVQAAIDRALAERGDALARIAPELDALTASAATLVAGGKRFRARFCYWGWQAVAGLADERDPAAGPDPDELRAVVDAAAALELFHAAALVHDDIMDNSDTRRGQPSAHRRFEGLHREEAWSGDAAAFGRAGALLLGDLLLGWSDEVLQGALAGRSTAVADAVRGEFWRMRTEVTAGQYLDMLEEHAWTSRPEAELLPRAHRVVVYKSAKYSVESPLALGASLAGAQDRQLQALRAFGLPLGVAFQLRDDILGVFGDPEVTGKPAGDDLREGKRTVLITLARQKLPSTTRAVVDELLGDPGLDARQVGMLQNTIRDSGALEQLEQLILRNVDVAVAALVEAPLTRSARDELAGLADTVSRRAA